MIRTRAYPLGVLLIAWLAVSACPLLAQVNITAPAADVNRQACDDFFTLELNNPADMSDTTDINARFPNRDVKGFTGSSVSSGIFSGVTTSSAANLYLWSPYACGSFPNHERYGANLSLDTSKYTQLSVRMYIDPDHEDPHGIRMLWDRSCNYASTRNVTAPSATKTGWHIYSIDLTSQSFDSSSTSTDAWTAGNIQGFALIPSTLSGATTQIDYVRLEDPTSCGSSYTASYTPTTQGNNDRASIWLDNDSNPFNGHFGALESSVTANGNARNVSVGTSGLASGTYNVIALLDSDYRTLTATDPWDMNDSSDVLATNNIDGVAYSNGALSGTTSAKSGVIYLELTDSAINADRYDQLSFKLTRTAPTGDIAITSNSVTVLVDEGDAEHQGGGIYHVDLSGNGNWTGSKSFLAIQPDSSVGSVAFSLDWVALRSSGFVNALDTSTIDDSIVTAAGNFIVNTPPHIKILEPNKQGGQALRPWNMQAGDFAVLDNLDGETDTSFPAESLSTYLPDVRTVDGLRGDFFKGHNVQGSQDPVNYSTFSIVANPISFSAEEYKNLCYKLNMPNDPFSLDNGSVARVIHQKSDETFITSEDLLISTNLYATNTWEEYCLDMTKLWVDGTTSANWSGTIIAFRVDPHEFTDQAGYYFDYVKLRKDDLAAGQYAITYELSDPDDVATVDFYYSANKATTGGTRITTASLSENSNTKVYIWDTSNVVDGTYYVYAVATDGKNENRSLASGRIVVDNDAVATLAAPTLSLESPLASATYCQGSMQVKGYALQSDRYEDVATVEVQVDGTLLGSIRPSEYSPNAVAAYPESDSSNSGFNVQYDISAFGEGAHTVTVKAYSTDGESATQTISINKGSSNCAALISDSDPSGTPVPPDSLTLEPGSSSPLFSKFKLNKKGKGSFTLNRQQEPDTSSCNIEFYVGTSEDELTTLVKTLSTKKDKEKYQFKAKIPVETTYYLGARKACDGFGKSSFEVKALVGKAKKKGVSGVDQLKSKMKLKKKKTRRKKKNRKRRRDRR